MPEINPWHQLVVWPVRRRHGDQAAAQRLGVNETPAAPGRNPLGAGSRGIPNDEPDERTGIVKSRHFAQALTRAGQRTERGLCAEAQTHKAVCPRPRAPATGPFSPRPARLLRRGSWAPDWTASARRDPARELAQPSDSDSVGADERSHLGQLRRPPPPRPRPWAVLPQDQPRLPAPLSTAAGWPSGPQRPPLQSSSLDT